MERSLIICVVFFIGFSYAAVLPNQKGKDRKAFHVNSSSDFRKKKAKYIV